MKIRKIFCAMLCCIASAFQAYAECDIDLMVIPCEQGEEIPAGSQDYLLTRLTSAVTSAGVTADNLSGQFFITGKFNHVTQDAVAGPPAQIALHTLLTLYIGDIESHKILASKQFELRGVGTSEQRAFINAFRSLNGQNARFNDFIEDGRAKVIAYFDSHYKQIIAAAERAAALHEYDRALNIIVSIPECSKGYARAKSLTLDYFKKYSDNEGLRLLNLAKAAWAKSPDTSGAEEAFALLAMIDPESTAYSGAQSLANEMKASVKDDRHFELRTKYSDSVDIEKRRIESARAVGVAFGNGQQPSTTNITWLR